MSINIKVLEDTPTTFRFVWDGVGPKVANVIRRIALGDVLTLAIETVSIYENSSVFFDEYIAHRLGLIPIKTGKGFKRGDTVKFSLDKEGPGTVYSGDLMSSEKKAEVMDKKIPIIILKEGQKLRIEAEALMGDANHHAKWQPGLITYQAYPVLKIDKDKGITKDCEEACPVNILEKGKKSISTENLEKCTLCNACRDASKNGEVEASPSDDKVIFYVESYGQIPPREILVQATEMLDEKAKKFLDQLKKKVK
ncbi:MAG: DNA-directed RNA polymerase subunit D [Candidatus Diapherotrites archaeon]|nr:DNA-directed RNA polymerase subunit D [Candidatus Diapherotrites archaeon]